MWAAMQSIETNRHIADMFEAKAATARPAVRPLLMDMAAQHRDLADQTYAQWSGPDDEVDALRALA
jgi:hypothetical protein